MPQFAYDYLEYFIFLFITFSRLRENWFLILWSAYIRSKKVNGKAYRVAEFLYGLIFFAGFCYNKNKCVCPSFFWKINCFIFGALFSVYLKKGLMSQITFRLWMDPNKISLLEIPLNI